VFFPSIGSPMSLIPQHGDSSTRSFIYMPLVKVRPPGWRWPYRVDLLRYGLLRGAVHSGLASRPDRIGSAHPPLVAIAIFGHARFLARREAPAEDLAQTGRNLWPVPWLKDSPRTLGASDRRDGRVPRRTTQSPQASSWPKRQRGDAESSSRPSGRGLHLVSKSLEDICTCLHYHNWSVTTYVTTPVPPWRPC